MDGAECSAADMERKLAAFRSRNANSIYRVIRRRINNNGEKVVMYDIVWKDMLPNNYISE